jgi:hypothetical protein
VCVLGSMHTHSIHNALVGEDTPLADRGYAAQSQIPGSPDGEHRRSSSFTGGGDCGGCEIACAPAINAAVSVTMNTA